MLFQKAGPNANANPVNKSREKVGKRTGTGREPNVQNPYNRCPICIVLVRFEIFQTQIRGNCGILYGTDPVPLGQELFFFFCAFIFSFVLSCGLSVCVCSMYVLRVNSCKALCPLWAARSDQTPCRPSMIHESAIAQYEGSVSEPGKRAIKI
ncbi:hypothetical protein V8C26DRAFT_327580 [Trichoderma gracile]